MVSHNMMPSSKKGEERREERRERGESSEK
jgi:hypothetical protein